MACEGQLLLLTPPYDDMPLEPIVLGVIPGCLGLLDEFGNQVRQQFNSPTMFVVNTLLARGPGCKAYWSVLI